jgi:hypothetical protein
VVLAAQGLPAAQGLSFAAQGLAAAQGLSLAAQGLPAAQGSTSSVLVPAQGFALEQPVATLPTPAANTEKAAMVAKDLMRILLCLTNEQVQIRIFDSTRGKIVIGCQKVPNPN